MTDRRSVRNRMGWSWRVQLIIAIVPLIVANIWIDKRALLPESFQMPLFLLALCSVFVTLPFFRRYKHALIALEKSLDTPEEAKAWQQIQQVRIRALGVAALPAWLAIAVAMTGMNSLIVMMLGGITLMLFWLYRLPGQLN